VHRVLSATTVSAEESIEMVTSVVHQQDYADRQCTPRTPTTCCCVVRYPPRVCCRTGVMSKACSTLKLLTLRVDVGHQHPVPCEVDEMKTKWCAQRII
jgi:hypothetical protein